ncbi:MULTISPECIES: phage tail protein I [Paenibacillus]|uniref:phage tail protein I n=1 Tax=Paenibacillus TaxID=44249 RepID=UPI0022B8FA20|nr:phage tail protein I [Paenibacillus caseinilyticus]MCZ8520117.1 phage tail protein I [Paenibacillus caseinilyticus]
MIEFKDLRMIDLVPPNLRNDPKIAAAAESLDAKFQRLDEKIDRLPLYSRMDSLTEEEANELAWQFHVDFYDPALPIEKRRELVKNSIAWHRRKGTPSAVEEVVSAVFVDAEVLEWFQYGGDPYRFKVVVRDVLDADKYAKIVQAINSVKNTRSWLDNLDVQRDFPGEMYLGFVTARNKETTILPKR